MVQSDRSRAVKGANVVLSDALVGQVCLVVHSWDARLAQMRIGLRCGLHPRCSLGLRSRPLDIRSVPEIAPPEAIRPRGSDVVLEVVD